MLQNCFLTYSNTTDSSDQTKKDSLVLQVGGWGVGLAAHICKKHNCSRTRKDKPDRSTTMTNTARLREKWTWKKSITKFATWNIISWSGRNHEILTALNNFKIDFCAISKTKKKGKGTVCIEDYILEYSGKPKEERAHGGVGLLIHKKYMNNIDNTEYISEWIIQVTLTFPKAKWCLLSLYVPDISKP